MYVHTHVSVTIMLIKAQTFSQPGPKPSKAIAVQTWGTWPVPVWGTAGTAHCAQRRFCGSFVFLLLRASESLILSLCPALAEGPLLPGS